MPIKKEMRRRGKRGVWYAAVRWEGVNLHDSLETTDERIAYKRLADLKIQVERGDYQKNRLKFSECLEKYEAEVLPKKSKSLIRNNTSIIKIHLVPEFSQMKLGEIKAFDPQTGKSTLSQFFDKLGHLKDSTVLKIMNVLGDIIRQGDKDFKMPLFESQNPAFYQKRFMTQEELDSVLALLKGEYRSLAVLMAYTGLDLGVAINLRWSLVNMKVRMIRLPRRGKTDQRVDVGICDILFDELKRMGRVRVIGDERIFTINDRAFQKSWDRAQKKTSIGWHVRPKDLRHFFASTLLNRGENPLVVAKLMGHKNLTQLLERYGHLSDDRAKGAVSLLDRDPVGKPLAKRESV